MKLYLFKNFNEYIIETLKINFVFLEIIFNKFFHTIIKIDSQYLY